MRRRHEDTVIDELEAIGYRAGRQAADLLRPHFEIKPGTIRFQKITNIDDATIYVERGMLRGYAQALNQAFDLLIRELERAYPGERDDDDDSADE